MIQVIVLARGGDARELTQQLHDLIDLRALRCSRPLVFVQGGGRAIATMVLDGGSEEIDADLATHLGALRKLSRSRPEVSLGIEVRPDGGRLVLSAGEFDDEEAVAVLVAVAPASSPGEAYVFELRVFAPPDLHAEVLGEICGAIARQLPNQPAPRVVTTLASVEMSFEVVDRERLARLVSEIGFAWRQLPWPAQTWATIRAPDAEPVMRAAMGREAWQELELAAREQERKDTSAAEHVEIATVEIGWHPQVIDLLGGDELHWSDRSGRALVLGREGRLCVRAGHRVAMRGSYEFVQDASGSGGVKEVGGSTRRNVAPAPAGWTRRVHHLTEKGAAVVVDSRRDGSGALSRVSVDAREGLAFRNVTALAVCEPSMELFLAGEHCGTHALITVSMGSLGWTIRGAWGAPWTAVDLGVCSVEELVAICVDGARARVVLLGLEYAAYAEERMAVGASGDMGNGQTGDMGNTFTGRTRPSSGTAACKRPMSNGPK